jgi:hypothetical protein
MWLCRIARRFFSDAIDGEPLPLLWRPYVACHRTFCPACKGYEKSLHKTLEAGRALRDLPFEEDQSDPPKAT